MDRLRELMEDMRGEALSEGSQSMSMTAVKRLLAQAANEISRAEKNIGGRVDSLPLESLMASGVARIQKSAMGRSMNEFLKKADRFFDRNWLEAMDPKTRRHFVKRLAVFRQDLAQRYGLPRPGNRPGSYKEEETHGPA